MAIGCVTQWHESRQEFRCPCHGSAFTKEGRNVAGPARRPLERCAIRLAEDGQLEIDTGRTFQEQLGEWDNVESFVEG
jgi:cytochrome b6-f complex iron-sulfur subunit